MSSRVHFIDISASEPQDKDEGSPANSFESEGQPEVEEEVSVREQVPSQRTF